MIALLTLSASTTPNTLDFLRKLALLSESNASQIRIESVLSSANEVNKLKRNINKFGNHIHVIYMTL